MGKSFIAGLDKMRATLEELGGPSAERIAKSVLGAGMTALAKAMKQDAPVGSSGAVKSSIGKRLEKDKKTGVFRGKVGVNVGKQKRNQVGRTAPHAHFVVLGTKPRQRRNIGGRFSYVKKPNQRQLSTGTMPVNHFVQRAFDRSKSAALAAMQRRFDKKLAEEVAKARS